VPPPFGYSGFERPPSMQGLWLFPQRFSPPPNPFRSSSSDFLSWKAELSVFPGGFALFKRTSLLFGESKLTFLFYFGGPLRAFPCFPRVRSQPSISRGDPPLFLPPVLKRAFFFFALGGVYAGLVDFWLPPPPYSDAAQLTSFSGSCSDP